MRPPSIPKTACASYIAIAVHYVADFINARIIIAHLTTVENISVARELMGHDLAASSSCCARITSRLSGLPVVIVQISLLSS